MFLWRGYYLLSLLLKTTSTCHYHLLTSRGLCYGALTGAWQNLCLDLGFCACSLFSSGPTLCFCVYLSLREHSPAGISPTVTSVLIPGSNSHLSYSLLTCHVEDAISGCGHRAYLVSWAVMSNHQCSQFSLSPSPLTGSHTYPEPLISFLINCELKEFIYKYLPVTLGLYVPLISPLALLLWIIK